MSGDSVIEKLSKKLSEYDWFYEGVRTITDYTFKFLWDISDTVVLKAKKGILRKRYIMLKDLFISESQEHEMMLILCKKITQMKYVCHVWSKKFDKVSEAVQEVNEILAKL